MLAERGLEGAVELHEVFTHEEAEELALSRLADDPRRRARRRSAGAEAPPALTCRIYRLPDGRVSPVPSREQLEEALR